MYGPREREREREMKTEKTKKKKGSIPFVNVTEKKKKKKKRLAPSSANNNPKTSKKKKGRRTTTTMAFGREQKKTPLTTEKKKDFGEEEEKGSKEVNVSFCCAFEEEEEEKRRFRIDVAAWTHVVKMMQHATTFEREAKEDAEILANAYLWKDGRVFPMVREALTTRAQTASEEKGRTVEALARQVLERWKTTKMKKDEEEKDANEIVLGVLETLKEEMAEAHRVGKLVKKKEKKETTDAETQKETTIDDGNEKVPLAVTLNFGAIIAQEMAAKEALWKPKDEEDDDDDDDDDEGDEACENLSVYETRCPARRNFEMRCEVRTQCVACQDAFVRNETLMQLSLDMPSLKSANNALRHHPLEVQLREFFQKKNVEKRCEKCGADVAEETRLFVQLPRYLLVHVNRFVWMKKQDDPSVNERHKLCWRISCPKNIPIATLPKTSWHTHPPDACTSTARNKSDGVYSLRAVLAHSGEDEEGGRTLLHVRNKVIEQGGVHLKETWTTHDGNILSTSSNARLNETERFEREAYVLLYSHPDFTF